jgi:uncharacterized membrane protein
VVAVGQTTSSESDKPRSDWEKTVEGLRWRTVASIIGSVVWLSFTLLYVGFWATAFSLFQSIIVILVSIIILGGVMGAVWTAWGPRYRHRWD